LAAGIIEGDLVFVQAEIGAAMIGFFDRLLSTVWRV
jgi:hypothetical protein